VSAVAFIIGAAFHEAAHAYVAFWLGDRTPQRDGRLTLNPLKHIDPLGLILVLIAGIGWARPVITNPSQFRIRDRKLGMLLVAIAGPLANLLLAIVLIPILRFVPMDAGATHFVLGKIIMLNVLLATFNLLPIYPLDGEKVLRGLLPSRYLGFFYQYERYGQFILLLILFIPPIYQILIYTPFVTVLQFLVGLGI
jgi:Zn-dependent protease